VGGVERGADLGRNVFIKTDMDTFTKLFWFFSLLFVVLSAYCAAPKKRMSFQIASGGGMFATSKIGRKLLGF
jgi:hypothetical protein